MRVGMLLAVLIARHGELVPADRLIEELWGAELPDDPRGALQAAASRLRKAVGPDRVVSRAGGYAVLVRPGELDADRFELLAREGRQLLARATSGPPRRGWPRRWRSGAGPPSSTSPTRGSPRARSRDSRSCGSSRSRTASRRTSAR